MEKNVVSASALAKLNEAGRYRFGERLYLQITASGVRSWVFRYKVNGVERQKGLGPLRHVSLSDAKRRAKQLSTSLTDGIDPLAKAVAPALKVTAPTFAEATQAWYAGKRWRSAKHSDQVISSLRRYAFPVLGEMPIDAIGVRDVVAVLDPIWRTKNETASRVLTRIGAVMKWAKARQYRSGDNPADWEVLQHALPDRQKAARHHAALSWQEVPSLFQTLQERPGEAARALAFTTLTAARSGEVLGARWSEFDLERKLWTVPASRMKSGRVHRVPLTSEAVTPLGDPGSSVDLVFPSLGVNAMANELRRVRSGITVHGMRSSFRDWAGDRTDHESEVAEAALAHVVGDKTERAYRRGDGLEKRAALMRDWAAYLTAPAADVVPIRRAV